MAALDFDTLAHKFGFLEGVLRAYSAPQDAMAALAFIRDQLEESLPELDRLIGSTTEPKRRPRDYDPDFDAAPLPANPVKREAGNWAGAGFDDEAGQGRIDPAARAAAATDGETRRSRPPMTEEHKQKIRDAHAARRLAKGQAA